MLLYAISYTSESSDNPNDLLKVSTPKQAPSESTAGTEEPNFKVLPLLRNEITLASVLQIEDKLWRWFLDHLNRDLSGCYELELTLKSFLQSFQNPIFRKGVSQAGAIFYFGSLDSYSRKLRI